MQLNFSHHIYQTLRRKSEQVLIVWPRADGTAVEYTGKALLAQIQAFSATLQVQGVQPGQPVLLAVPVSVELIGALLAVLMLGAVPVLPPAGASPLALLALLRRSHIKAAIAAPQLQRKYGWLTRAFGLRLLTASTADTPLTEPLPVSATQPALVSHSSGSTGRAKAIRRSHEVLSAQHRVLSEVFPSWNGQRDFPLFPNILLHNLSLGVVSVLPDVPWSHLADMEPARIVRQLQAEQVQTLTGNVFYFTALCRYLQQHPTALHTVRALGVGGSPVPETLLQALKTCFPQAEVYVIYGSSEAEPIAVRQVQVAANEPCAGYCVGPVVSALECRLRPIGHISFADGRRYEVGEITVRGSHVATTTGDWLHTGDFGYFDEQGQLWLTGRQGNEAIHEGVQHYQIEHVLLHLAGVERAAARAHATGFEVYVQGSTSDEAIRHILLEHFPAGLCNRIHRRTHLPVDRRHLSKILYDQLR